MDIIIRDVEEKDGQYKIYNKDGTGGHWYITKESAEVVSSQLETLVMQKIAEIKDNYLKEYGCNSCWSDDHNCTCEHDKWVIIKFYDMLNYKLKDSNFSA